MWLVMADGNGYILKVSNLGVKMQNQTLLDHVSFNVRKGTTLAILGPNGAGKTVLLAHFTQPCAAYWFS